MPKYRDPGADDRMKAFESSLRKTMQGNSKKKKSSTKTKKSPCGQGSLSGSTYKG